MSAPAKSTSLRSVLIAPLALLAVVLLEEVAAYKVRQRVHAVPARVFIILLLYGIGFAIAAGAITPWLRRVLTSARSQSRKTVGSVGPWIFFGMAYAGVFYAFWLIETLCP